ncbi:hypothetical protein P9112_013447 [Eukaryota sp. TZLM1-RC]
MATGLNVRGALCLGDESSTSHGIMIIDNNRYSPVKIVNYENYKIVQASCWSTTSSGCCSFTIFLAKEGDVYSCGEVLGRPTDSTFRHTPGKVQGLGRVRSIGGGSYIAFADDFNNVLFSWEEGDDEASINTQTRDYEIGSVFAGASHFFIQTPQSAAISALDNSLLKVNGTVENIAESSFTFEI